jgi:ankyrin repeat protein
MLAAGKEGHRLSLGAGKDRIEKLNPHDPGTLEIVRALLAKGAKVNALSASGVSALILAAAHNNAPIVGVLVQAGADVKQTSRDGKTASQIAEANGNNNVVSLLRLLEQSGSN